MIKYIILLSLVTFVNTTILYAEPVKAFEGAMGWSATTAGGRGGAIVRVTNLQAQGQGSLKEAVEMKGPRIIVFEVGGVIDLQKQSLVIKEPYLTIAGQTAPSPGITLIRGGLIIGAHDVIVRHIRVRPGEAGAAKKSGWEVDGITTTSYDIIVDHCSCSWATDENLTASGPRFNGKTVEEWRKNTSHRVTISNCIIAEGLNDSTHGKGKHSKGSLIHDNCTEIAIIGNLYANNVERNPLFKAGTSGVIVNNYIFNTGGRAVHFGSPESEWKGRQSQTGQLALVANVFEYGPSTPKDIPLLSLGWFGPLQVYTKDNIAIDQNGKKVEIIRSKRKYKKVNKPPLWPKEINVLPVNKVRSQVLKEAGARPWDRDEIDKRIIQDVLNGKGKILDSEQEVGGYPTGPTTRLQFDPDKWDMTTMERK